MSHLQNLLGIIYENENEADGMQQVLEELHEKFVPYVDSDERQYSEQGFVADQLSVERGVNCLPQLENGFTPKERLEGIHFEIADFHGGMKFLQVCSNRPFSCSKSNSLYILFKREKSELSSWGIIFFHFTEGETER